MKMPLGLLFLCLCLTSLQAAPKRDLNQKQARLEALKNELARVQDSLETAIARRWNAKQQYVEAREQDKEQLVRLRDEQERALMESSRVKEEQFAWRRRIEEKRNSVDAQREARHIIRTTFEELLTHQADDVMKSFPLDRENNRLQIEEIREKVATTYNISSSIREYAAFKADNLRQSREVDIIEDATVLTDDGHPHTLHVARLGSVFAYGMGSESQMIMIRQTGRLDAARFSVAEVKQLTLKENLAEHFPSWVEQGKVTGDIPTDILQNAESAQLISGETLGTQDRFIAFVKAGGPIMFVLLILPVWAVVLIVAKGMYLYLRSRREKKGMKDITAFFKGDKSPPGSGVLKGKSTVEKMYNTCVSHHEWDRYSAEKALRGIMLEEFARLSRHLPMLAVIAGVAPLLGLLGTVTGMINLFQVITTYGTSDPKIMAGGISEALITTQTGLAIAIPVLLCHSWLKSRKTSLAAFLERNAIEVLNHFWPGVKKVTRQNQSSEIIA